MKRLAAVVALLVCGISLGMSAAWAADLKPIPAAQAEKLTAEARDALTDRLWIGLDDYWHAGKWEDCLRLCKEIFAIDPTFVEAYTSAAWLLWSTDRDAEAVAIYEQGIAANPDSPDLYFEYAFYHHYRKHYEQVIPLMRKAIEKRATRAQQHLLPNTLEEMGRKQEALAEWQALQKRFPGDPIAKNKIERLSREVQGAKQGA